MVATATSFVPSDDDATEAQEACTVPRGVQVTPAGKAQVPVASCSWFLGQIVFAAQLPVPSMW
jgi:hypothetical protein